MLLFTMQSKYAEISGKFSEDFRAKLKINGFENEIEDLEAKESSKALTLEQKPEHGKEEEENEEEEDDFSFACSKPDGSPISADDAFQNGQIRPTYPLFNRDLLFADNYNGDSKPQNASSPRPPLKKLFVEDSDHSSEADGIDGVPAGAYCAWSAKAVEASPERCKKSNSTGSSKLWKLRERVIRSHSDGKDAFVFLNPSSSSKTSNEKVVKSEKGKGGKSETASSEKVVKNEKRKGGKSETASSAHERLYVENRAIKEGDRRRSYLPYKQVGFFTNVNGLSRNVHPF